MDARAKAVPLGYEQLTGITAAKGLTGLGSPTPVVPDGPNIFAVIVAEAQAVRWRDDGTDPSTTVGMHLAVNTEFVYSGTLSKLKFIEETATAKVNVSYYRHVG